MSEEKRILELDRYEHRAIADIVNEKRKDLLSENKDNEFIDEILEKILNAPAKKKSIFKKEKYKDER